MAIIMPAESHSNTLRKYSLLQLALLITLSIGRFHANLYYC